MILLLANVGNHDLRLSEEGRRLLPQQADERYYTPRRLGEEVVANFERYREEIQLQLLAPTIEWLLNSEGIQPDELSIVLFASNQNPDLVAESEWLKDTFPAAQAMREYAHWRWRIPKKAIHLHRIDGSPADYTNMLDFFQRTLPDVKKHVGKDDRVYIEVSGGTPAMASMLIVMGVEVFGEELVTLYLDRVSSLPYKIGVAQALFTRKTREMLRQQTALYSYTAALGTLRENERRLHADERIRDLLRHLLTYADRRLAFDYKAAQAELQAARALAVGTQQALIGKWQGELNKKDSRVTLAELIHSATIKLHLGDYADFTQRLFRFQEALFRHMAEQMGMQYGKGTQYLSNSWRESLPELDNFLKTYNRTHDGNPIFVNTACSSLNRFSLGAIVDYFVQQAEWAHWRAAAEGNFALARVADLRNKGIAGHGFEGISGADLEAAYGQPPEAILQAMHAIYTAVFGTAPAANPYDVLNEQIDDLLKEAP